MAIFHSFLWLSHVAVLHTNIYPFVCQWTLCHHLVLFSILNFLILYFTWVPMIHFVTILLLLWGTHWVSLYIYLLFVYLIIPASLRKKPVISSLDCLCLFVKIIDFDVCGSIYGLCISIHGTMHALDYCIFYYWVKEWSMHFGCWKHVHACSVVSHSLQSHRL